ncbi:hypothetical protein AK812_SmicGene1179 [Symbiodinium microadriaticum]|uniref:Uncharacterized protein n=1 Tax=Symbiodinium microadriaticum TaxID=2951 RepID=A0A1Q9F4Z6_SYMMI|nr:hypothetical protein AK812_SmicGene1179 [Symbiodinium microadriaticum]
MVKRFADLTTLASRWENVRSLRERCAKGHALMRATADGCVQCMGTLKDCAENNEVLKVIVGLMLESLTIDSNGIDMIVDQCTAFLELAHYPDKARLGAIAVRDAWGIKRCLTTLRRKWGRYEAGINIPRRVASDDDVGSAVAATDDAYPAAGPEESSGDSEPPPLEFVSDDSGPSTIMLGLGDEHADTEGALHEAAADNDSADDADPLQSLLDELSDDLEAELSGDKASVEPTAECSEPSAGAARARAIEGPLTVESDDEVLPSQGGSLAVDHMETQAFVVDTQVMLDPILAEEKRQLDSPASNSVARELFPDGDKPHDKPSSEPSDMLATSELPVPVTDPAPSTPPASSEFMEFSPPQVITRGDQLALKNNRKADVGEEGTKKRGRPAKAKASSKKVPEASEELPVKAPKAKASAKRAPKAKASSKKEPEASEELPVKAPKAKASKKVPKAKASSNKEPEVPEASQRERASSSKDIPVMVPAKRARALENDAEVMEAHAPKKCKRVLKKGRKGKKGKGGKKRPAMMAFPVPEEAGDDDGPTYSEPVVTGGRPSLKVFPLREHDGTVESVVTPLARRSIRRKRVAVAEPEPAEDVADPEPAEHEPEPAEEEPAEPDAPKEVVDMPNVFAGRRCPKTVGAKGWLVWQHIVKSFVECIDPNLPERSRTKHEYDYWKTAKTAFDEDDSVVSEGDFKSFFLVQAEVYVQENVIPPIQVILESHDGIQTKARIYPAGLGMRLLQIFKFLKTSMAPCNIRGDGDALEMFRCATYEDECSDAGLQEVPGAMDPVAVKLARALLSRAWSGEQKPEEPVEQDEREKLLELLQSQAKLIEQLRGGASSSNLCKTPDAKRNSNRSPRRRLRTKTPSPNAKNKTASPLKKNPSPSKKHPSPSKKDPSPSKKDPSPSKKDPSPVKKDQPVSRQTTAPKDIPDEDDAKFWNRMRSKVNRFCGATTSGKLQVSDDIHAMWKKAGASRDVLVSLMAEANGDRGDFVRKVEVYKESQKFRRQVTDGGFYSEREMAVKVSEGGIVGVADANPSLKRINKYDGETEYWVDTRDKLNKFMERLDTTDASVIKALGNLYDELAKLQADAKVQDLTGQQHEEYTRVCESVKRQMIMATSLEIKNKKLKKKPGKPSAKRETEEREPEEAETNPKKKLKRAKSKDCVEKLRRDTGGESLAIFKIGITHDCTPRFQLYESNGYTKMLVMHSSNDLATIEMLESALIAIYRDKVQCRNVQLGGEGMRNRYFEAKFASAKHVATIAKAFATEAPHDFKSSGATTNRRTYRRDELMVVAFQPILGLGTRKSNPLMLRTGKPGVNLQGHSFTTRFLTGVMPKAVYKDHPERFDNFITETMKDFEKLYYHGYDIGGGRTLRFIVLGIKGDLPFLSKAGHLNRTFLNIRKGPVGPKSKPLSGCCWLCHAGSAAYDFEDLSSEPKWLETSGVNNPPPWEAVAPFFDHVPHVVLDKASFFTLDVLHIYHLGIGRDYAGSALVLALRVYGMDSVPEALDALNVDFQQFLKGSRKQVHFKKLTRDMLGYSADTAYPVGHWSKASDTPVLIEFASWVLQKNKEMYDRTKIFQVVVSGATAIARFMKVLLEASLWMSATEAVAAGNAGLHFLRCYQKAAELSYQAKALRFNMTPKLHCFHHVSLGLILTARRCDNVLNPLSRATFQDEDYIGRVSRLSRRISPRLLCLRTIQRYLIATRVELDKDRR